MNEIKSTDSTKVVEHLEKGAKFDLLKTREGYYRNWDHQLMIEMHSLTFKPVDQVKVLERGSVVHHGPAADLRDNLDLRRSVLWM